MQQRAPPADTPTRTQRDLQQGGVGLSRPDRDRVKCVDGADRDAGVEVATRHPAADEGAQEHADTPPGQGHGYWGVGYRCIDIYIQIPLFSVKPP